MNKIEAYQAMDNGHKIRHIHFSDDEFLHMVNGVIRSEEGYNFEIWWDGNEPWKEDGWSIA